MGRNYKQLFAAPSGQTNPVNRVWFDGKGQLVRERDADNVNWLYCYNGQGHLEYEALDVDRMAMSRWRGLSTKD